MKNIDNESRARGSLLAGALGDALGYMVESLSYEEIKEKYGECGITEPDLYKGEEALISDDTQMTLYTAEALLKNPSDEELTDTVYEHYLDWLGTQIDFLIPHNIFIKPGISSFNDVEELHSVREPGMTCIYSLYGRIKGSMDKPINDSKGCGGIMKTAPMGLYYGVRKDKSPSEIGNMSAEIAALTHGHELGYIPTYCAADIIARIMREGSDKELRDIIEEALKDTSERFEDFEHIEYFSEVTEKALRTFEESKTNGKTDEENIRYIGEGWVAEETLSIAIYCALKYEDDLKKALTAAVNHGGDSDSTGAVTGNILGAYLGYDSVPQEWLEHLELKELIEKVAINLVKLT